MEELYFKTETTLLHHAEKTPVPKGPSRNILLTQLTDSKHQHEIENATNMKGFMCKTNQ